MATLFAALALYSGLGAAASKASDWTVLSPKRCLSLAQSKTSFEVPENWKKYSAAIRVCPLGKGADTPAETRLVSIFADDYYRSLPKDAPWEDFPRPLLIDAAGKCLARVPELFPFDEPRDIVIRYGRWQNHRPTEIRIHAKNPAVGGDYDLPPLQWQPDSNRYEAAANATPDYKEKTKCQ